MSTFTPEQKLYIALAQTILQTMRLSFPNTRLTDDKNGIVITGGEKQTIMISMSLEDK